MQVLVDTCVLLRLLDVRDPKNALANECILGLHRSGHQTVIARQNVYELWVVATRPVKSNGLGFSVEQTRLAVDKLGLLFTLLPDPASVYSDWLVLVTAYKVSGKSAHDARLAAFMLGRGIRPIVTFNAVDFKRYAGIEVIEP